MNDNLISREWLEDAFDNLCCHNCKTCRNFRIEDSFYKCALIDNAPTAEQSPVIGEVISFVERDSRPKGEWITRHKLNSFGQDVVCFECNECGEYKVPLYHLLITEPLKVCPNCGADMRKGDAV